MGGDIDFIDQSARSGYVHQYSIDVKRALTARMSVSIGYLGSRSERLALGGTIDTRLNINQLDPRLLFARQRFAAAGAESVFRHRRLRRPCPVPHDCPRRAAATVPTVHQCLRPPRQRRAVSLQRVERGTRAPAQHRTGAGASTTCSACARTIRSAKATPSRINAQGPIDSYDLDREFGYSLLDAPHRLNISGSVELPFGPGKRWLATGGWLGALAGGWTVSGVGWYQSGFPVAVIQPNNNFNLLGSLQRPNIVPGVNPRLPGSPDDNYDPDCRCIP